MRRAMTVFVLITGLLPDRNRSEASGDASGQGRGMATIIPDGDQGRLLATAGRLVCAKRRSELASWDQVTLAVPGGRGVVWASQTMVDEALDRRRLGPVRRA